MSNVFDFNAAAADANKRLEEEAQKQKDLYNEDCHVLAGEAAHKMGLLINDEENDARPALRAVNDVLNGIVPSQPALAPVEKERLEAEIEGLNEALDKAETVTDEERELLEAFRSGRVKRTDKGAWRDTEWSNLHPRTTPTPATPASTPVVVPAAAGTPAAAAPAAAKKVAAPVPSPAPAKPKGLAERAKAAAKQALANAKS